MPSFCAIRPVRTTISLQNLKLNFDVDASGEVEFHQGIHRLRCRINDIEYPFVRPNFKLLTTLLIDMRANAKTVEFFRSELAAELVRGPGHRFASLYLRSHRSTDREHDDRTPSNEFEYFGYPFRGLISCSALETKFNVSKFRR